jgi:hypothetical protein
MRYLIYINNESFYTDWFDYDNHYLNGMIVFDLMTHHFTTDGKTWLEIKQDHL